MRWQWAWLFTLGILTFAGCGKNSPEDKGGYPGVPLTGGDGIAARLPADTLAYVRVRDVGQLKEKLLQTLAQNILNSGNIQGEINKFYPELFKFVDGNPFGLTPAMVQRLVEDTESISLAVAPMPLTQERAAPPRRGATNLDPEEPAKVIPSPPEVPPKTAPVAPSVRDKTKAPEPPPDGKQFDGRGADGEASRRPGATAEPPTDLPPDVPEFIVCLQCKGAMTLGAALSEMNKVLKPANINGASSAWEFSSPEFPPFIRLALLDNRTLLVGTTGIVGQVAQSTHAGRSLAEHKLFSKALTDLGSTGELFAFVNLQEARKAMPQMPMRELGAAAASFGLNNQLTIRAYATEGMQFPDFLARTPKRKELMKRIPADALFVSAYSYDGGRKTRQDFISWLRKEMEQGRDTKGLIPDPVATFLVNDPERIEKDVVVKGIYGVAQEFMVIAIPVKSELAMFVAPNKQGKWGGAVFFDIEDQEQVATLRQKLLETPELQKLPWKKAEFAGTTLHYVDVEEMMKQGDGAGAAIPPEVRSLIQLQLGYAINEQFLLMGTMDAMKFALQPDGQTLDAVIDYKGVDAENAQVMTIQVGRFLHGPTPSMIPMKEVQDILKKLAQRLGPNANYTLTFNLEPQQLTLKANIPIASIAAWLIYEFTLGDLKDMDPVGQVRTSANSAVVQNNLRQIWFAMMNHDDDHKSLPRSGINAKDPKGKPMLSWRVALLPYLEQDALYRQFKQDEPWDSPHNIQLLEKMPKVYAHPGRPETKPGYTHYQVFVTQGPSPRFRTPFELGPGPRGTTIQRIASMDGTANTIMVVEAADPIPWTKPDDLPYDEKLPLPRLGTDPAGFYGLFCDGTTRFIRRTIPEAMLRALLTYDDGMLVNPDDDAPKPPRTPTDKVRPPEESALPAKPPESANPLP